MVSIAAQSRSTRRTKSFPGSFVPQCYRIKQSRISMPPKLMIPAASISLGSLPSLQSKPISSSPSSSPSPSLPTPTRTHITHLILDQNSAFQALETFKWATKIPNFTHSQSTYRALIHKLCIFRRFDIVKELLDEMPRTIQSPPDESIFITIIRGLGRARMMKDVIKVNDMVSRFNMTPSLKIYNSILDVLVKEDIDLARKFYRKKMMATGVVGDGYTYGILMKGLCLTNRIGDGYKLLQVVKSQGVEPNTVVYNTLIHALCKNRKVGRARSLVSDMEQPNNVTFSILISAYCKEGKLVLALALLEKSFSFGFVPDVVTFTKVLELLCGVGRVMEAVELLERVEMKGGMVDVVAYNTLINGFCRLGKVQVGIRFFKEMERKGCLPNVETYNILISSYCVTGLLDSALDMFHDMKRDGISWNFVTYDTLIRGLCSGGRTDYGLKILEAMEESKEGSKGRISPYNSVLYGLYRENREAEALEYLKRMEELFPKAVDRSLRVLGLCVDGRVEDAKRGLDEMIEEGGHPSVVIYDSLIHAYCGEERAGEGLKVMKEMVRHGYLPIASTFNALVSGLCRQGKVGSAMKLVEEGGGGGGYSYSTLMGCLYEKGDLHNALKLLFHMVGKGVPPDYSTWNSLLFCLAQQTTWSDSDASLDIILGRILSVH